MTKSIIESCEATLAIWDVQSPKFTEHWKNRGNPVASNLRGTLKNKNARYNMLASLQSDLNWCLFKAKGGK